MNPFQLQLNRILTLIFAVILIPFSALTHGIDLISSAERTDESKTNVVGIGAYFRSQGITSDGDTFWFSSKTTLIRTMGNYRTVVNANYSAIPEELSELGIKHIGGLSYYNGFIYAGLEDSKVWDYPIIGVYDAETLELVKYYIMDAELITRGMPWVTVDPATGLLYCADHSKNPTKLLVYDTADEMAFVKEIPLSAVPYAIQGAEFCSGTLYAATNDDTQAVYAIDVADGSVEKVLDRNLTSGSEGEGMTFVKRNGETVLVAMDMGPLFINAFVREYNY
ncbi:MAG: PQQ-like beta-propeller repeat protein [Clostridia bacterium]|nr:PQQ-like beta-propeller repeat protein [Clostridia bacterium]